MTPSPRVFVVQDSGRDWSSASRYGALVFLLAPREQPSLNPTGALMKIRKGLRDFRQEDYITFAGGDPLGGIFAGLALGELGFSSIQLLRWERERSLDGQRIQGAGYYVPVNVQLRPANNPSKVFIP